MAFPFMGPFAMPAMAPPPGFAGKTQYHYLTKDGGPPNQGKPPAPSGAPPPYSFLPPAAPCAAPQPFFVPPGPGNPGMVCYPNKPAAPCPTPHPFFFPPAPSKSGIVCYPNRPAAPAPPPGLVWIPPAPAPAAPPCYAAPPPLYQPPAAAQPPEPPVSGNRVKDNLVVLPQSGGVGLITPKHHATFHIFSRNLLKHYPPDANNRFHIPPNTSEPFHVQMAPCFMQMDEFIEQLDCIKDAPVGWPRSQIGIAEVFDLGNGWFEVGTKFMLDDERSKETLAQIWGVVVGEAGCAPPRYVVKIPGKDQRNVL